jgi:hypothetical protein
MSNATCAYWKAWPKMLNCPDVIRQIGVSEVNWSDGFFVPADERLQHRHDLI